MLTTVLHAVFTTMLGLLFLAFYTGATSLLSFLTGPSAGFAVGFGVQLRKGTKEISELTA